MSKEFPLYPELSEQAQIEAQELMSRFTTGVKKVIQSTVEDVVSEFYTNILPYIESDSWTNFRNEIMDGFKNYDNRKIQAEYDFKEIRKKIYEEFRDDLIKDLNQDLLKEIEDLKKSNEWLRECISKY